MLESTTLVPKTPESSFIKRIENGQGRLRPSNAGSVSIDYAARHQRDSSVLSPDLGAA